MSEFIKYVCKFCDKVFPDEEVKFIPPSCSCEDYKKARAKWLEEYRSSPDYEPPLLPEEYEKKYPVTFKSEKVVEDNKLKLEARQYEDGEGLTVWKPLDPDDEGSAGICYDFTDKDAIALYEMLEEYLKRKE